MNYVKDLKKLPEVLSEVTLANLFKRIVRLEERMSELEGQAKKANSYQKKEPHEMQQIGSYEPYINKCLENNKVWSVYNIEAAIKEKHPEVAHLIKLTSIQSACSRLQHMGKINKVANLHYKKKD